VQVAVQFFVFVVGQMQFACFVTNSDEPSGFLKDGPRRL